MHVLSLLVAILPLGGVLADATKSKNAKLTLVDANELPKVPGKSIKGMLVERPGRLLGGSHAWQIRLHQLRDHA